MDNVLLEATNLVIRLPQYGDTHKELSGTVKDHSRYNGLEPGETSGYSKCCWGWKGGIQVWRHSEGLRGDVAVELDHLNRPSNCNLYI